MAAIEVGGGTEGDVELATGSFRSLIGHAQDAGSIVAEVGVEFVWKSVARSGGRVVVRGTGLYDEVGNDTVKREAIVEGVSANVVGMGG